MVALNNLKTEILDTYRKLSSHLHDRGKMKKYSIHEIRKYSIVDTPQQCFLCYLWKIVHLFARILQFDSRGGMHFLYNVCLSYH